MPLNRNPNRCLLGKAPAFALPFSVCFLFYAWLVPMTVVAFSSTGGAAPAQSRSSREGGPLAFEPAKEASALLASGSAAELVAPLEAISDVGKERRKLIRVAERANSSADVLELLELADKTSHSLPASAQAQIESRTTYDERKKTQFKTITALLTNPAEHEEFRQACEVMVERVVTLLKKAIMRKAKMGIPLQKEEVVAFADLKMREQVHDLRMTIQKAVSFTDLKTALIVGEVWTQDDQERMLNACYEKDPLDKLEEKVATGVGELIVQGDMVLPKAVKSGRVGEAGYVNSLLEVEESQESDAEQPGSGWSSKLWYNGEVRYCFKQGINKEAKESVLAAMRHIIDQVPCIKFMQVHYDNATQVCKSDLRSVVIQSSAAGCWSAVGAPLERGARHFVNLGMGCETMGLALHQLGHLLGMVHTLARSDRDTYVELVQDNSDPVFFEQNFPNNDLALLGMSFDFLSIMFDSYRAFSINGKPTIKPRAHPLIDNLMGQRMGLSQGDVEQLSSMYGCRKEAKPFTMTKELGLHFLNGVGLITDGSCVDSQYTGMLSMPNGNATQLRNLSCWEIEDKCTAYELMQRVRQTCPSTCLMCVPITVRPPDTLAEGSTYYLKGQFKNWLSQYSNYTNETATPEPTTLNPTKEPTATPPATPEPTFVPPPAPLTTTSTTTSVASLFFSFKVYNIDFFNLQKNQALQESFVRAIRSGIANASYRLVPESNIAIQLSAGSVVVKSTITLAEVDVLEKVAAGISSHEMRGLNVSLTQTILKVPNIWHVMTGKVFVLDFTDPYVGVPGRDYCYIDLSGFSCTNGANDQVNGQYKKQPYTTSNGRPVFRHTSGKYWFFYDENCGGYGSMWLIGCRKPNLKAPANLQGAQGCCNYASIKVPFGGPVPTGTKAWDWLACGDDALSKSMSPIQRHITVVQSRKCYDEPILHIPTYWPTPVPTSEPTTVAPTPAQPLVCVDSNYNCKGWAAMGQCVANRGWMSMNCQKSCDTCQSCFDRHPSCAGWSDKGFCQKNPGWMNTNCKRSCNVCYVTGPTPVPATSCQNETLGSCIVLGCSANLGYTMCDKGKCYCREGSCNVGGVCKTAEPTASPTLEPSQPPSGSPTPVPTAAPPPAPKFCVDLDRECAGWAASGGCKNNKEWMIQNCNSSCWLCQTCRDTYPSCNGWARKGECQSNSAFMFSACPKACGRCLSPQATGAPTPEPPPPKPRPKPTPPPTAPPTLDACVDLNRQCEGWALKGECTLNPDWMNPNCKKSCNQCDVCANMDTSCPQWAQSGECSTNPGWMHANCAKSCDVAPCKVECKDTTTDCEGWSVLGECTRNEQWMSENCKKSCNPSCKRTCDDQDESCGGWAMMGECSKNLGWMSEKCRLSCNLCEKVTLPKPQDPNAPTCKDEDVDCAGWAILGECQRNPQWMAQRCAMSCGGCNQCVDKDNSCSGWAQAGECQKNLGWMSANCMKSCNKCPGSNLPTDSCSDTDSQCVGWAAQGECEKNIAWMSDNCKKSCKICGVDDGCVDSEETCTGWAADGECMKNPGWMFAFCPNSCGKCKSTPTAPTPPPTTLLTIEPWLKPGGPGGWPTPSPVPTCVDMDVQCTGWKASGECEKNPAWMSQNCNKSCGTCEAQLRCKDTDAQCSEWAGSGECQKNKGWMTQYCNQSCGVCNKEEQVDCKDENPSCSGWAELGECESNRDWMEEKCKKSCRTCLGHTQGCSDSDDQCPAWSSAGECTKNPEWMSANCMKSCDVCSGGSPPIMNGVPGGNPIQPLADGTPYVPPFPPPVLDGTGGIQPPLRDGTGFYPMMDGGKTLPPPVNDGNMVGGMCEDADPTCSARAALGECQRDQQNMASLCKKTCGFCNKVSTDPSKWDWISGFNPEAMKPSPSPVIYTPGMPYASPAPMIADGIGYNPSLYTTAPAIADGTGLQPPVVPTPAIADGTSKPHVKLTVDAHKGSSVLEVETSGEFSIGDEITIAGPEGTETRTIIGFSSLILDRPLEFDHPKGFEIQLEKRECSDKKFSYGAMANYTSCSEALQGVGPTFCDKYPMTAIEYCKASCKICKQVSDYQTEQSITNTQQWANEAITQAQAARGVRRDLCSADASCADWLDNGVPCSSQYVEFCPLTRPAPPLTPETSLRVACPEECRSEDRTADLCSLTTPCSEWIRRGVHCSTTLGEKCPGLDPPPPWTSQTTLADACPVECQETDCNSVGAKACDVCLNCVPCLKGHRKKSDGSICDSSCDTCDECRAFVPCFSNNDMKLVTTTLTEAVAKGSLLLKVSDTKDLRVGDRLQMVNDNLWSTRISGLYGLNSLVIEDPTLKGYPANSTVIVSKFAAASGHVSGTAGQKCTSSEDCDQSSFCNFDYGDSGICEVCHSCRSCHQCGLRSRGITQCRNSCSSTTLNSPRRRSLKNAKGKEACQCIDVDPAWRLSQNGVLMSINDGMVTYSTGTGSRCDSWDDKSHPDCKGDGAPSWCKQSWCYVDPCICDIDIPPKISSYMPDITYHGLPLYYSYATCGGTDNWTASEHPEACVNQKTKSSCVSKDKCAWFGGRCIGEALMMDCGDFSTKQGTEQEVRRTLESLDDEELRKQALKEGLSPEHVNLRSRRAVINGIIEKARSEVACVIFSTGPSGEQQVLSCATMSKTECFQPESIGYSTRSFTFTSCEEALRLARNPAKSDGIDLFRGDKNKKGMDGCACVEIELGENGPKAFPNPDGDGVNYPANVGSYCDAWDDKAMPECSKPEELMGKQVLSWCKSKWCFIDECTCDRASTPVPEFFLPGARYKGRQLYYSYATCGYHDPGSSNAIDEVAMKRRKLNPTAFSPTKVCPGYTTKAECDSDGECGWTGELCVTSDLVEFCTVEAEPVAPVIPDGQGNASCPCITVDFDKRAMDDGVMVDINGKEIEYQRTDLGSYCKAWDNGRHPENCLSPLQIPGIDRGWCAQEWCFVDPCNCGLKEPPRKSLMLGELEYNNKPIYYSYETCGGIPPPRDPLDCSRLSRADGDSRECDAREKCMWIRADKVCVDKAVAMCPKSRWKGVCSQFAGVYADGQGGTVVIEQQDGCKGTIAMKVAGEQVELNVTMNGLTIVVASQSLQGTIDDGVITFSTGAKYMKLQDEDVKAENTPTYVAKNLCKDSNATGIKFSQGKEAECFELHHYCDHPKLGSKVKGACPFTCGMCNDMHEFDPTTKGAKLARCNDLPKEAEPQIRLDGQLVPCSKVKWFCRGHDESKRVQTKCPETCGACLVTTTVSTTTAKFEFSTRVPEDNSQEWGCDRRRRWGFCMTRRRRVE